MWLKTTSAFGALFVAGTMLQSMALGQDESAVPFNESENAELQGIALSIASQTAAAVQSEDYAQAGYNTVNGAIDYLLGNAFEGAPAWAQRIQLEAQVESDGEPTWSILTVQPLYQSDDDANTVFTQVSQRRYDYLGTDRDVTNLGVGYRHLLFDNTLLIGANSFFDYEWDRWHQRLGAGVEAKWSGLDLTTNSYFGLGGSSSSGLNNGVSEEVLDGYDFELGAQLPYMPWARLYGKYYTWDTKVNDENIDGWQTSLEADISQNISAEYGWRDDNFSDPESFFKISFRLGFGEENIHRPVALSSEFISDRAWEMRDMSNHTLDEVRRENRIIVERISSGVVITRSN